jgi:hypothetical protein
VSTVLPVHDARLSGTFHPCSGELFDHDFCRWLAICACSGDLLEVLGQRRSANGFAGQPTNALEGEYWVGRVGEVLVLQYVSVWLVSMWIPRMRYDGQPYRFFVRNA